MAKKSNISLKNLLVIVAAALAIAACCMMFLPGITTTHSAGSVKSVADLDGLKVLFGGAKDAVLQYDKGAIGAFIGYVLAGVGGIALVVSRVVDKKFRLAIAAVAFVLIVAAAVLVFLEAIFFMNANNVSNGTVLGYTHTYKLGAGPIVGGILAGVSSVSLIVASVAK